VGAKSAGKGEVSLFCSSAIGEAKTKNENELMPGLVTSEMSMVNALEEHLEEAEGDQRGSGEGGKLHPSVSPSRRYRVPETRCVRG